jgi:peptidoglycan L-alanyl-D-glutamate endopeptidase CwlK
MDSVVQKQGEVCVGMDGSLVVAIQDALAREGFPPGAADGHFGPATEAAVIAFQKSQGLLDDGMVGPRTAAALGLAIPPGGDAVPEIDLDLARRMFPNTPTPPLARHLPLVMDALRAAGLTASPMVLAALATIRAETEGFVPLDEGISRYNTSPGGHAFDLYDHRRDLGNEGEPDGARFKGRGFVQLTGRRNYARLGAKLGVDLLEVPEQANDPAIAARLLAAFLADVEVPLRRALLDGRLATARRLVNGGTNGIARFADAYITGAQGLGLSLPPLDRVG